MKRFPQDYSKDELVQLVVYHRDEAVDTKTKLSELRDKFIKVSKELSQIKKAKP